MKANNRVPVKHLHGSIYGQQSEFYFRVLNGQQIVQRKPQKASKKQLACRATFVAKYRKTKPPDSQ